MADTSQPQAALPTAADVDAAAPRSRAWRCARRWSPRRCSMRCSRRARVPEGRDAPAHRLVQVPRRLQQAVVDPAGPARRRRRGLFLRQPCAGRGGGGATARHAGGDRDAVGRAAAQARAHRRARRRGRALRSRPRGPRGDRARHRRAARRGAGAAVRRSDGHRRAGHRRPRDRRGSGCARAQARRRGGRRLGRRACIAGIALAIKARVPQAKFYYRRAGRLRRHRALVQRAASARRMRA